MRSQAENELQHQLIKCITACETCADMCLNEDNVSELANCIRTNRDCADVASLVSRMAGRGSDRVGHYIQDLIKVARENADECSRHDSDHCQKCAEICRETAGHCEKFQSGRASNR